MLMRFTGKTFEKLYKDISKDMKSLEDLIIEKIQIENTLCLAHDIDRETYNSNGLHYISGGWERSKSRKGFSKDRVGDMKQLISESINLIGDVKKKRTLIRTLHEISEKLLPAYRFCEDNAIELDREKDRQLSTLSQGLVTSQVPITNVIHPWYQAMKELEDFYFKESASLLSVLNKMSEDKEFDLGDYTKKNYLTSYASRRIESLFGGRNLVDSVKEEILKKLS